MNWGGSGAFFAMGGYGVYVWGAYGVAALCLLVEPVLALRRLRRAQRDVARLGSEGEGGFGEGAAP